MQMRTNLKSVFYFDAAIVFQEQYFTHLSINDVAAVRPQPLYSDASEWLE
jgi:hypothetical protein